MTGKQFKAAREAMGLSVSQLADKLDVNRSTVFRIEQTECTRVMALAMQRLAQVVESESVQSKANAHFVSIAKNMQPSFDEMKRIDGEVRNQMVRNLSGE